MKEVSYKFGAENNFIHIVILQQYYNFIFGGIFMKKFISMFLSAGILLFSNFNYVAAGGIDKEEILEDGTKLIYVSTENIPEVYAKYYQQLLRLKKERYSTAKDLTIKGASLATAGLGYYLSSHLPSRTGDNSFVYQLCGKIISCIIGAIGFFYPDYVDHNFAVEHGEYYEKKPFIFKWGPKCNHHGAKNICNQLQYYHPEYDPERFGPNSLTDKQINSGAVIVIRPKSKWNKEGCEDNSIWLHSGVYPQSQMEPDLERGIHGFRWALINNCIPIGE